MKVANAENPINKNPETAFETHLNKYPTIYIDVTDFTSTYHDNKDIIKILSRTIKKDIREAYPDITISPRTDLMGTLVKVYEHTGEQFILIIDEWDALCRELAKKPQIMEEYVRLLRSLFKSGNTDRVFAAVYMTGILPIKQYGTQSALNNFQPYSMINPDPIGGYYGFTKDEVMALCEKYDMPYQQMEKWYDGYNMGTVSHVFNPTSVMLAIRKRTFDNYWSQTSSFEAIRNYINMDFDGVKQTIENLLIGGEESVPVLNYGNDQNEINSRDELFALLTHYGYFAYDNKTQKVHIPNQEVRAELLQVVKTGNRPELTKLIKDSDILLQATLAMDEEYVAEALDAFHSQYTTPRFYNNEQALRALVRYAYIGATGMFVPMEELPTGKGFADVAFIPVFNNGNPVILVELKYDDTADTAIAQIKDRRYPEKLEQLTDNLLLVGISYNKETKKHSCKIEKLDC